MVFARIFVSNINPTVTAASKGHLEAKDLKPVGDSVGKSYEDFLKNWQVRRMRGTLWLTGAGVTCPCVCY